MSISCSSLDFAIDSNFRISSFFSRMTLIASKSPAISSIFFAVSLNFSRFSVRLAETRDSCCFNLSISASRFLADCVLVAFLSCEFFLAISAFPSMYSARSLYGAKSLTVEYILMSSASTVGSSNMFNRSSPCMILNFLTFAGNTPSFSRTSVSIRSLFIFPTG